MYVPMGAAPPADSLGDAVVFLASDLSAYTTGSTLYVDGGTSASMGFLHWPGTDGRKRLRRPRPPFFREDILDAATAKRGLVTTERRAPPGQAAKATDPGRGNASNRPSERRPKGLYSLRETSVMSPDTACKLILVGT